MRPKKQLLEKVEILQKYDLVDPRRNPDRKEFTNCSGASGDPTEDLERFLKENFDPTHSFGVAEMLGSGCVRPCWSVFL